jgi:hypothetical protein
MKSNGIFLRISQERLLFTTRFIWELVRSFNHIATMVENPRVPGVILLSLRIELIQEPKRLINERNLNSDNI